MNSKYPIHSNHQAEEHPTPKKKRTDKHVNELTNLLEVLCLE
jgi:hypothetical protein